VTGRPLQRSRRLCGGKRNASDSVFQSGSGGNAGGQSVAKAIHEIAVRGRNQASASLMINCVKRQLGVALWLGLILVRKNLNRDMTPIFEHNLHMIALWLAPILVRKYRYLNIQPRLDTRGVSGQGQPKPMPNAETEHNLHRGGRRGCAYGSSTAATRTRWL
jgi:hypothetical protein